MIVWCEGRKYPVEVEPGDILFIGGRIPRNSTIALPFEHVAVAAQHRVLNNDSNLLDLLVYGMPESERTPDDDGRTAEGLAACTGRRWLGSKHVVDGRIGSRSTVWNLCGRASELKTLPAANIGALLAVLEGALECKYEATYAVDTTFQRSMNCLGFVCSFLAYCGVILLSDTFPEYRSPYLVDARSRRHPSPGHLAHVLRVEPKPLPWQAVDSNEASRLSRVDATLEALLAGS